MRKKIFGAMSFPVILFLLLFLSGCTPKATVTAFELGEGLPVWTFNEPRYEATLPKNAQEQGLVKIYAGDSDHADVYLYHHPKKAGETLESFGNQAASEHQVFCNMMKKDDSPVAVINYFDAADDQTAFVQSNIFDGKDHFVQVDVRYKTEKIQLANSPLTIRMISKFEESSVSGSLFPFEKVYRFENDYLPTVTIRQFPKNYFSAESGIPDWWKKTTTEAFAGYTESGLTLEEIIALYQENYDLKKGELMHRNDLDIAFIGYIDQNLFQVKAFIDNGEDFIMLDVDDDPSTFQHITNALIDSIGK